MECNKDEAMRAKDIAARKFTEGDFAGAKKFALKAQSLYHGLEGISQMITTLEVYISAGNKINGEIDMYGILGVSRLADDDTIKKQYRKLLLQLHPDKNKFIGADGAFQRVTEAFNLLSDKTKRADYNSRCNIKTAQSKVPSQSDFPTWPKGSGLFQRKCQTHAGVSMPTFSVGRKANQKVPTKGASSSAQQKVPAQSGSSPVASGANGFHKSHSSTSSRGKATKSNKSQKATPPLSSFFKKHDTFWTKCNRCMMQYEYMRVYLNQILKCPHCQRGFQAVEVPPPSNLSQACPQQHRKPPSSSGPQNSGPSNPSAARWSPMFGTKTYNNVGPNDSVTAKATNDQCLDREKAKRDYEAALAARKRERDDDPGFVLNGGPSKKMKEMHDCVKNYGGGIPSVKIGNGEASMGISAGKGRENSGGRLIFFSDLSATGLRKMLSEKALLEIRQKLKEWKLAREARIAAKEKENTKRKERQKSTRANEEEAAETVTVTAPDSDFHVFDMDRSESCFGDNQVWAAYDDNDGMPRIYAMIHNVISTNPFKVRLSWLNSKNYAEFGPLDCGNQGLIKSCGDFVIGKRETSDSLNSLSHKVRWVRGPDGVIQVYPGKGEIWALYRNWSPDWNKDTPENIIHAYDLVEVLDEYNADKGVRVASLMKANGFLSIFRKQPEPKEVKRIPKEEIFRFSHQVPSHILTGEEGPNAPKGYIELDPASTPSEYLQKATAPGINGSTLGTRATAY